MVDIKKIRAFAKARKNELSILEGLDEFLTEVSNAEAHLKALKAEAAKAKETKTKADRYAADKQAAADLALEEAKMQAAAMKEKIDGIRAEADALKAEADDTLARAKAEADRIEAAGRQRGIDLAEGEAGNLKKIRDDIKAAQAEKATLDGEIEVLVNRKAEIEREIARIKAM